MPQFKTRLNITGMILLCLLCASVTAADEGVMQGVLDWQKMLGGSNEDAGFNIQQTTDGGVILTGSTYSSSSGDVGANHGGHDVWVVKLNSGGSLQWQKVLGGSSEDYGRSITQTSDGGFILTGETWSSNSGDVGANHGRYDVWVVKLNSAGTLQWQKVFGGSDHDYGSSITQTSDGGFILTGSTYSSSSGDVGANHGSNDVWVVKLNSAGTLQWQKVLGGSDYDTGMSISQTSDGGFILIGITYSSSSGDVGANHGSNDVWVVKLNSAGTLQWQKVLGGSDYDMGYSIQQTSDGGFILTGYTDSSSNGDVGANHGNFDIWVVKLNSAGVLQWQKMLGGSDYDTGMSISQTSDGGFILTGSTYSSSSGDVGANHGYVDVWVVKLNSAGTLQWQKVLGGSSEDSGQSITQTSDGGFILTGYTDSSSSGDVGTNHGNFDIWVVKLHETPVIRLYPGWNFVSIPRVLKAGSDTAGTVFSGVNTDGHSILLYNASTKAWQAMSASSKVKVLDGIWIYSKYSTTVWLTTDPNPILTPQEKPVPTGWNAIGFSNTEPAYAIDTLSSVRTKWSSVIGFDAEHQRYETAIINGGSGIYSDYRYMNPTKGYWLGMMEPGTLLAIGA